MLLGTFDLPVLALRSLRAGVQMGWYYREQGLRHRYSENGHIDLCDWLADHGATRSSSLDALARLIGLPGKVGVDGSQIEGLYNAGQIDHIRNYCLADVAQTALLFLRFRLLQGVLSRERYEEIMTDVMADLRADPRLATLMKAIDGERLLRPLSAA
jgi:predicted PolB exonuclease-like 3'-5' exonuclease